MNKLYTSPQRGSFHIDCELKSVNEGRKTPQEAESMIQFYRSWEEATREKEQEEEFKIDNLEYDLRSSDYIHKKCKVEHYAQNLYAALCNNDFVKNDVWPLLTDKRWSCSWRYAGGIIAHIRQEGDYIDWYCSGIFGDVSDEEYNEMTKEHQESYIYMKNNYVPESHVTDEIREDLLKLGWIVVNSNSVD